MKSVYRYIAFDVETPNRYNNRMSAIGISVIEEGAIKEEFFSYVNPETHFDSFNTQLTGISENTVKDAPAFPILWKEKLEPSSEAMLGIMKCPSSCMRVRIASSTPHRFSFVASA